MLVALFLAALLVVAVASIRILVRFGFRTFAKVVLGFAALFAGFYGLVRLGGCTDDDHPALADEVVAGHHRLRHPTFDFAFAHPGDAFIANPELAEKMEPISGASCDAFVGKRGDALFAVCAVDGEVTSREELLAAVADVRRGMSRALAPRPGEVAAMSFGALASTFDAPADRRGTQALQALAQATPQTLADDVGYANGRGTAYVHLISRGMHLRIKLFTVERGLAMMIVVSSSDGVLDDVVTSFAPVS
jgi:hypothetical protein